MEIADRRLRRQLDLTLGLIDALEPDLRPGVDLAKRVGQEIRKIRGAGSRDRRFYRELVFTWFRYREWIDPARVADRRKAGILLIALAGRTGELQRAKATLPVPLCDFAPAHPEKDAILLRSFAPDGEFSPESLIPDWLPDEFPTETTPLPHTMDRPPIWIRTAPETVGETTRVLRELGFAPSPRPEIPGAIALPTDSNLEDTELFRTGRFEIQDIASQAVLTQADPGVGEHWFDACAGAGGKSLQLAQRVGRTGKVTATDIRPKALEILRRRARRTGLGNLILLEPRNAEAADLQYDGVLVDAPCSATGTWRRRPFLRHQTNPETIRRCARIQNEILARCARRVRPGGRLVYATCSLCRTENQDIIRAFLDDHHDFRPERIPNRLDLTSLGPGQFLVRPERFNGDGFFLATLLRS